MAQARVDVLLQMRSDLRALTEAQQKVAGVQQAFDGLYNTIRTGAQLQVGAYVTQGLAQVPGLLRQAAAAGISFNAQMETAQLGLGAVFKQFDDTGKYADFSEAVRDGAKALELLKTQAKSTPGELRDLVAAYQGTVGEMARAGMTIREQVELISLMSQTLGGLGIHSSQILQESRAIVSGNINMNAQAAQVLGITRQQILAARESGELFDFLMGKMDSFRTAAELGQSTFQQMAGNMKDALDQVAAAVTEPLFEGLKDEMEEFKAFLESGNLQEELRTMGRNIADLAEFGLNAAAAIAKWSGTIGSMVGVFAALALGQKVGDLVRWVQHLMSAEAAQARQIRGIEAEIAARKAQSAQLRHMINLQRELRLLQASSPGASSAWAPGITSMAAAQQLEMNRRMQEMNTTLGRAPALMGRVSAAARSMFTTLGGAATVVTVGFFAAEWWRNWAEGVQQAISNVRDSVHRPVGELLRDVFELAGEDERSAFARRLEESIARYQAEIDKIREETLIERAGGVVKYYNMNDKERAEVDAREKAIADMQMLRNELYSEELDAIVAGNQARREQRMRENELAQIAGKKEEAEENLLNLQREQLSVLGRIQDAEAKMNAADDAEAATQAELIRQKNALAEAEARVLELRERSAADAAEENLRKAALSQAESELLRIKSVVAGAETKLIQLARERLQAEIDLREAIAKRDEGQKKAGEEEIAARERLMQLQLDGIRYERQFLEEQQRRGNATVDERQRLKSLIDDEKAAIGELIVFYQALGDAATGDVEAAEFEHRIAILQRMLDLVGEGSSGGLPSGFRRSRDESGWVQEDLSRMERARAGVQGQEIFERNDDGDLVGTGRYEGGLADPTRHYQSAGEGVQGGLFEMLEEIGTLGDIANEAFLNMADDGMQAVKDGLYDIIASGGQLEDIFRNLGQNLLRQMISSVVDYGVQWLLTQGLIKAGLISTDALQSTLIAKKVVEVNTAEAATLPAKTAGAAASSISSFGIAAVVGIAALAAALAMFGGAFAEGGVVRGPGGPKDDKILAMLSNEEFVVKASASVRHRTLLHALNAGMDPVQAAPAAPVGIAGGGMGGGDGGQQPVFMPVMVNSEDEALQVIRNHPEAEAWIADVMYRNRGNLL